MPTKSEPRPEPPCFTVPLRRSSRLKRKKYPDSTEEEEQSQEEQLAKEKPEPILCPSPVNKENLVEMPSGFYTPVTPSTFLRTTPRQGRVFRFPEEHSLNWDNASIEKALSPRNSEMIAQSSYSFPPFSPKDSFRYFFSPRHNY
mmetsp:Transcript_291/g.518  ORF Transcript_291/g.518 Transcript_291/m.518 type:complete len:144 (-) Transcript_291:41-472(-)